MKNIYKKLRKVYRDNIDLRPLLDEKFPEIFISEVPYVTKGSIFLRSAHCSTIYSVCYSRGEFYVRNCTNDAVWTCTQPASNESQHSSTPYLNEFDFNTLLNGSGTDIEKITVLEYCDLREIHKTFNKD